MSNESLTLVNPLDFERADLVLSPYDPEFHYMVVRPRLSAELAEVRKPRPVPTSALIDGSARARRDGRIANRGAFAPL